MPRPSTYTAEVAALICDRIMDGESLRTICAADDMPNKSTVFRWLDETPEFATRYARAREAQGDEMDGMILEVAKACTPETAAADRVKIDAFKWRASKLAPKRYGEKMQLAGDPDAPLEFKDVSDRDRARAMMLLATKVKDDAQRTD